MRFADITRNMDVELGLFVIQPSSLVPKAWRRGEEILLMLWGTGESVETHYQLC
jgi:hypothetical protein